MGYTTEYYGEITIQPALNAQEIKYIQEFGNTRRMSRSKGDYYIEDKDGGMHTAPDIIDCNSSGSMPSLWCGWTCNDEGTAIIWNGSEKFYKADIWMKWIIEHFLSAEPLAKESLPFLQGHVLNGEMDAIGEELDDRWQLIVEGNKVFTAQQVSEYGEATEI